MIKFKTSFVCKQITLSEDFLLKEKKTSKTKILSKSKLMTGLQCHKALWLTLNSPELGAEIDTSTQMQFDEGHEVGELARNHYGKGYLTKSEFWDFSGAIKETLEAISSGEKVIFEAAFSSDEFYARADILSKTKKGWDLIEVKKSTSVKDYHIQDAGIQSLIIEGSGVKLNSIKIMHINNKCVYPNLDNLFTLTDITEEVRSIHKEFKREIFKIKSSVFKKTEPKISIGPHCSDPFECAFVEYCWKKVPEKSVFDLPSIKSDKAWELFNSGIKKITQLKPSEFSGKTRRAIEVTKSNDLYVEKPEILEKLEDWQWPLYFFDFETIGPAIPRYKKTSPYQQIPFQFSCHVWESPKSTKLKHFEYLHTEKSDPRPSIIKAMLKGLGNKGSIVAYNMSFEKGVINKLSEFDKVSSKKLEKIIERFVDPLPIFREHVYHPDFLGSFSIKNVGPALLGNKFSYDDMEVGDGSTAQAWADQLLRGTLSEADASQIVPQLLEYCRKDTLIMVELVKWMMGINLNIV